MPLNKDHIYLTQNDLIDEQHKQWIDLFNQLEERVLSSNIFKVEDQVKFLERILDVSYEHFRDEEYLFEKYNYPHKIEHRRMHKEFHQKIYFYYRQSERGEFLLDTEILKTLKNWFLNHTAREDKRAFEYINSKAFVK